MSHKHHHREQLEGIAIGHDYKIAFIGQPNVGKTTLYNSISGENREIGNWAGTTIEIGYTSIKSNGHRLLLVDLPGTYSLIGLTKEEYVVADYLEKENLDAVVVVTDISALPRNLYLFLETIEVTDQVILVVNMLDEAKRWGINVNLDLLGRRLGVPVVGTIAIRREGVSEVLDKAIKVAMGKIKPKPVKIDYGPLEKFISEIEDELKKSNITHKSRWLAIRILSGDKQLLKRLKNESKSKILSIIEEAKNEIGEEPSKFIVTVRYRLIDKLLLDVFARKTLTDRITESLDKILLNSRFDAVISMTILGITMYAAYQVGSWIYEAINYMTSEILIPYIDTLILSSYPTLVRSFFIDAILGGLDLVISFFPLIFMFTLTLSFLENSGVIARLTLALDRFFAKFDSSGRSAIPILMGASCNVIGVTTTRMIFSPKERTRLILTLPFVQCSTRQAVLAVILALILPPFIAATVFISYIILGFIIVLLLNRLMGLKEGSARIPTPIELPPYRIPPVRVLNRISWVRTKHFIIKAGKAIVVGNIILWILLHIPPSAPPNESLISYIGSILAFPFYPLGFTWKEGVALLTGILAKELTLSSLDLLYGGITNIPSLLSMPTIIALTTVFAYYSPCFPTMTSIKMEAGRWKETLKSMILGFIVSLILGYFVYGVLSIFLFYF